jgi:hypothetical protein
MGGFPRASDELGRDIPRYVVWGVSMQCATAVGRVLDLNAAAEGNVITTAEWPQQAGADQQLAARTDAVVVDRKKRGKKRKKKRGKKHGKKRRAHDTSQQQSPRSRWLRNGQLAAHFGVTVMTVWRWKHDQKLKFPPGRLVNGIEYNDRDKADAWMRSQPIRRGRPPKVQNTNLTQETAAI